MILRFEIDEIRDVRRSSTLRVARVTEARARGANRFVFACETVAVKRANFEVIDEQRRTIVFLPLPIFKGRQRGVEPKVLAGVRRPVSAVERQRFSLSLPGKTSLECGGLAPFCFFISGSITKRRQAAALQGGVLSSPSPRGSGAV